MTHPDFYRRKDFDPKIGVGIVAIGFFAQHMLQATEGAGRLQEDELRIMYRSVQGPMDAQHAIPQQV